LPTTMRIPQAQPTTPSSRPAGTPQALGNDLVVAALLSGVAGYVDTAGFLALYGLFTAHVTGDLVTAGAVVAERLKSGAPARLAMIPIFMLAVAATALFARRQRRRGREPLTALLALMTLALAIFGTTGVALRDWALAPDDWAVAAIGATGVVAMAIQNTLMRDALSSFCPTTIMTGNLTQVTIDLVDICLPPREEVAVVRASRQREAKRRLKRFGLPLLGFMVGAAAGALLTHAFGLWSIALPTAVVGALTGVAWQTATATATATAGATQTHNVATLRPARRVAASPRHASGMQLVGLLSDRAPSPPESGTYAKAEPFSRAVAPSTSQTAQGRRRAR